MPGLTPDVVRKLHELIHDNQILMAIQLYRNETGVSLAEAKAAVERMSRNEFAKPPDGFRDRDNPVLEGRIKSMLSKGHKIDAVKIYREEFGVGLQEAKDAVDRMEASLPRDPSATGHVHSYEPAIGRDPFEGDDGRLSLRVLLVVAALVGLCGLAIWILMTNV